MMLFKGWGGGNVAWEGMIETSLVKLMKIFIDASFLLLEEYGF